MEEVIVTKKQYNSNPFLTIVTRTYKKPNCLKNNIKSVEMQTDLDVEQVIIQDTIGKGLAWADTALNTYKCYNNGEYILVLDDDDKLLSKSLVVLLKDIANRYNPNLIVWRGYFSEIKYALPPLDYRWGKRLDRGLIGSFNYCTKRELYNKYVFRCTSGISGDFDFMEGLLSETPPEKIYWVNKILVTTQQKSFGRPQDKTCL